MSFWEVRQMVMMVQVDTEVSRIDTNIEEPAGICFLIKLFPQTSVNILFWFVAFYCLPWSVRSDGPVGESMAGQGAPAPSWF